MSDFVPQNIGDLFFLVMPNRSKTLMRVVSLVHDGTWSYSATAADLDDAIRAVPPVPVVEWCVTAKSDTWRGDG